LLRSRRANDIVAGGAIRKTLGDSVMLATKVNLFAPVAALIIAAVSIEPAFAGTPVPAPIIGAGLPVLAVLGGGYWLIRKLRQPR
jgi:hypothetical protein